MDDDEVRRRVRVIIEKYARRHPWPADHVRLMRCSPSKREIALGRPKSFNKIIYDTYEQAKRASQEIFQVTGVRTEVYTCHRSTRKHHKHLTTDDSWMFRHGGDKRSHPS